MKLRKGFLSLIAAASMAFTSVAGGLFVVPAGTALAATATLSASSEVVGINGGETTLTISVSGVNMDTATYDYKYNWTVTEGNYDNFSYADGDGNNIAIGTLNAYSTPSSSSKLIVKYPGNVVGKSIKIKGSLRKYNKGTDTVADATPVVTSNIVLISVPVVTSATKIYLREIDKAVDETKDAAGFIKDNPGEYTVSATSNKTFTINSQYDNGTNVVKLAGVLNGVTSRVTYISSDTSVATITPMKDDDANAGASATLSTKKSGTTTVTATLKYREKSTDAWSTASTATMKVTVAGAVDAGSLKVKSDKDEEFTGNTGTISLTGSNPTRKLTVEATQNNTFSQYQSDQDFTWEVTGDTGAIELDKTSGKVVNVTAIGNTSAGAKITVTSKSVPTQKVEITVTAANIDEAVLVDEYTSNVAVNGNGNLSAFLNKLGMTTADVVTAATDGAANTVHYMITNDNEDALEIVDTAAKAGSATDVSKVIATLKGKKAGTANIVITAYHTAAGTSSKSEKIKITVGGSSSDDKKKDNTSVTVSAASTSISSNGTTKISTSVGNGLPTGGTWKFTSDNSPVATVDDSGNVTAKKDGKVTITGTYTVDGKSYTDSVTITVNAAAPTVSLSTGGSKVIDAGSSVAGSASVTNLGDKVITYSSSNPTVATVTAANTAGTSYVITGKSAGTTVISASIGGVVYAQTLVAVTEENKNEPTPTPDNTPKVNQVVTFGGDDYTITSINGTTGTVTLTDVPNGTGTFVVPGTITVTATVNGKQVTYTLTVTKIAKRAFAGKKYKKVKIAGTVQDIAAGACRDMKNLNKVVFMDDPQLTFIGKNFVRDSKAGVQIKGLMDEDFAKIRAKISKTNSSAKFTK